MQRFPTTRRWGAKRSWCPAVALGAGLAAGLAAGLILALATPGLDAATPTPTVAASPLKQASNLIEWGRWNQARVLLAEATQAQPNDAPLKAYLAHILVAFGDVDRAQQLAQEAVAEDPNCASCHVFLGEALGEHARHAGRMRALMQLRNIKKELRTALQLDPNSSDVQWGWLNFDLNVPSAVGGSATDAMAHANAIAGIDPVDGHLARAAVYESTGHKDQALAEYRSAAAQSPNDPRGLFSLGQALFRQGDYAGAEPYLARAAKLQPRSGLYAAYQAAALIHLNREVEARAVLAQSQPFHPDDHFGDYAVAEALHNVGKNFAWARQLLAQYLAAPTEPDEPNHADAQKLLAAVSS